ncbi:hypothetical protein F4777DRAFT_594862 [Nemania sp. FL0916]|nr:hypothetical protein F4777DRAFT_594862 [Nemania sp. FL0916]
MESYFGQHSIWSSGIRGTNTYELTISHRVILPLTQVLLENRGLLIQSETDKISRESTDTPHVIPSPPNFGYEQFPNHSLNDGKNKSPNYTPSEKSTPTLDDDSLNEPTNDTDLKLERAANFDTISDGGRPSDEESEQASSSEEESDQGGPSEYNEPRSSAYTKDITSLDWTFALPTRAFDVQESSSITISDDFSNSAKVEERQFLALHTIKKRESGPLIYPIRVPGRLTPFEQRMRDYVEHAKKVALMTLPKPESQVPTVGRLKSALDDLQPQASGSTFLQDASYQDNSRKRLYSQLQLDDQILGLDVDELQGYIMRLEQRAKDLGASVVAKSQPALTHRVLYRILNLETTSKSSREAKGTTTVLSAPFFDPPEWIGSSHGGTLRCQVPVQNFDLFLEKNKNISFIVFKTYVAPTPVQQGIPRQSEEKPRIKVDESIKPITQELIEAVKILLTSKHEYEDLWHDFMSSGELLAPYLFVYHQRPDQQEIRASMETSSQEQMIMLWDYIIQNHGDEFTAADSCISRGKISAKYMPYLFKPGDVLVQKKGGLYLGWVSRTWARHGETCQATRGQLVNMTTGASQIPLYETQYASTKMSDEKLLRRIESLEFFVIVDTAANSQQSRNIKLADEESDIGIKTMPIQDLHTYPLQFAPEDIVRQLRMRGKTFWKCRNRGFVSYEEKVTDQETKIDERYMIDLKAYRSLHKNNQYESVMNKSGLADELGPEAMDRDEPPDEKFEFLLPATIKGFNMRRKKWYDLVPERVREVGWNKEAFQKVVMNSKAKDLIQALVSNQLAVEARTPGTDLIEGKGNGLILLLHGGPGTGKTLTAESVAEIAEKPLYRVTCADIGTKAEDAEKYLESVLHLGKLWRCVVLLDEADVFLEQRSLEDLERNALVSAFLRILEYYEGILILTTNRVGTFDEAFKSRIQLALHYPALGPYQRLQIWQNFLDRFEKLQDDTVETGDLRDHLDELSKEDMNGRQIRNALTTARQYARWKGEKLNYAQLKDVIEVSGRFDKYLVKLHKGLTHDQLAQDEGLR